jgi:type II secretory pathway pseudopilin PulG
MAQHIVIGKHARHPLGFTYMGLLMVMAIASIGMAGVAVVWHQEMQREREKELLFIGEQYRQAIGRYYENAANGSKQYPEKLADLLLDKRGPTTQRYLRQLYADPMQLGQSTQLDQAEAFSTATASSWGLVKDQNRIIGVYSRSQETPIKTTGFPLQYDFFAEAKTYQDWKFMYSPLVASVATSVAQTPTEVAPSEPNLPATPLLENPIPENATDAKQD